MKIPRHTPAGNRDLISLILEQGGVQMPRAKWLYDKITKRNVKKYNVRGELSATLPAEFDGYDSDRLRGTYHTALLNRAGGGVAADVLADMARQEGLLGENEDLWARLYADMDNRRAESRRGGEGAAESFYAEEERRAKVEQKQGNRFENDAKGKNKAGRRRVLVSNLNVGDEVEIGGETLTVTDVHPDTLDVTLEDGKKYGVQTVADGEVLFVQQVKPNGDSPALNKPLTAHGEKIKQAADHVFKGARNAPPVIVVNDESELPAGLVEQAQQEKAKGGYVEGFFNPADGKVYLLANNLQTARAVEVALHEIVGHYGLRGLLGANATAYNKTMDDVYHSLKDKPLDPRIVAKSGYQTLSELAENYNFDLNTAEGQRALAEELLSRYAEFLPVQRAKQPTWFRRALTALRNAINGWLRGRHTLTDADILELLRRSHEYVKNGGGAREGSPSAARFAKSAAARQAEEVGRRWLDVAKRKDSRQYGEFLDHPLDEYEDVRGVDSKNLRTLLRDLDKQTANQIRIVRQFVDENDQVNQTDTAEGREVTRLYNKTEPGSFIQINEPDSDTPSINSYYSNSEAATPIYQAIYAWAHNNGKVIVPDKTTTGTGLYRRNSQMLNSALRFGTTEHMRPNPENQLDWREGDHAHNIGEMARKEAEHVSELFNGLFDDWRYDAARDRFYDSQNTEIQPAQIRNRIVRAVSSYNSEHPDKPVRAGFSTVRRALATRAFQESGGRQSVSQSSKASPSAGLNEVLYSKRPRHADARRQYEDVVQQYTNPDGTKKAGWLKATNGEVEQMVARAKQDGNFPIRPRSQRLYVDALKAGYGLIAKDPKFNDYDFTTTDHPLLFWIKNALNKLEKVEPGSERFGVDVLQDAYWAIGLGHAKQQTGMAAREMALGAMLNNVLRLAGGEHEFYYQPELFNYDPKLGVTAHEHAQTLNNIRDTADYQPALEKAVDLMADNLLNPEFSFNSFRQNITTGTDMDYGGNTDETIGLALLADVATDLLDDGGLVRNAVLRKLDERIAERERDLGLRQSGISVMFRPPLSAEQRRTAEVELAQFKQQREELDGTNVKNSGAQIKSATDNNGEFSGGEPSILMSKRKGEAAPELREYNALAKRKRGGEALTVAEERRLAELERQLGQKDLFGESAKDKADADFYAAAQTAVNGEKFAGAENVMDYAEQVTGHEPDEALRQRVRAMWDNHPRRPAEFKDEKLGSGQSDFALGGVTEKSGQFALFSKRARPYDPDNGLSASEPTKFGNALVVPPVLFAKSGWHGTPHQIDPQEGFLEDKVGTGEGAAAYGWGVAYIGGNRATGEFYRDSLSRRTFYDGEEFDRYNPRHYAARELRDNPAWSRERLIENLKGYDGIDQTMFDAAAVLEKGQEAKIGNKTGNLYQVEINAEDNELLDWDAVIDDQPRTVWDALENADLMNGFDNPNFETNPTGGDLYRWLVEDADGDDLMAQKKDVSKRLLAAGLKGIRYLDGGSRNQWRAGRDALTDGGAHYATDGQRRKTFGSSLDDKKLARQYADEQNRNRTSNYVVFDERDIKITHENDVPVSQPLMSKRRGLPNGAEAGRMSGVSDQRTGTGTHPDATLPAGDTSGVAHRADPPVKVIDVADNVLNGERISDLRVDARKRLTPLFGQRFENEDTGWKILFNRRSLQHLFIHKGDVQIHAALAVPDIIRNAVYVSSETHEPSNKDIKQVHRLAGALRFRDNLYTAKLVVKEHTGEQGHHAYDIEAISVKKNEPTGSKVPTGGTAEAELRTVPAVGSEVNLSQLNVERKPENAKKILAPNPKLSRPAEGTPLMSKRKNETTVSGVSIPAGLTAGGRRQFADVVRQHTNPDGTRKTSWLKAPNGEPTRLTEPQWVQTRTPSFKQWFGDWEHDPQNASKVVDANGEPLTAWRGYVGDYVTVFDTKQDGIHFSNERDYAESYSTRDYDRYDENGNEYGNNLQDAFLNLKRVLDLREVSGKDDLLKRFDAIGFPRDKKINPYEWSQNPDFNRLLTIEEIAELLDDEKKNWLETDSEGYRSFNPNMDLTDKLGRFLKGYADGIIFPEHGNTHGGLSYVVFDNANIKSATANNGEFSGGEPSILMSKRRGLPNGAEAGRMSGVSNQWTGTGTHPDATLPAGDTSGVARRAANGRPSHLTNAEYARAMSPEFKAEYGDWEALGHRQFLDGEPVKTLTGDEFKKDLQLGLIERVEKFYHSIGGVANSPVFGAVKLGRRSIKDSLGHGLNRNKAAAFAAVPDIIEKGRVVDRQSNWKGRGYDSAVIVAPVDIGGREYVGAVIIKMDENGRDFYLHEVELKEAVREEAFKTAASAPVQAGVELNTAPPREPLKKLLRDIYAVNPESVKISLDENGEPDMSEAAADGEQLPNLSRPDEGTPLFAKRHAPSADNPEIIRDPAATGRAAMDETRTSWPRHVNRLNDEVTDLARRVAEAEGGDAAKLEAIQRALEQKQGELRRAVAETVARNPEKMRLEGRLKELETALHNEPALTPETENLLLSEIREVKGELAGVMARLEEDANFLTGGNPPVDETADGDQFQYGPIVPALTTPTGWTRFYRGAAVLKPHPNASNQNAFVVLTAMWEQNKAPIIAAVHLDKKDGPFLVNRVASVYGKERGNFYAPELLRYVDQQRGIPLLKMLGLEVPASLTTNAGGENKLVLEPPLSARLQLPMDGSAPSHPGNIRTENDIVKHPKWIKKLAAADGDIDPNLSRPNEGTPLMFKRRGLPNGEEAGRMSRVSDQRTGTGTHPDATLPAGDTSGVVRRAANGQPSRLTDAEYARATSPEFKAEYGDWEALGHRQFLDGAPLTELQSSIAPQGDFKTLTDWAADLFAKQGGVALNPHVGEVVFDKRSVRDSLAHGGANKFR